MSTWGAERFEVYKWIFFNTNSSIITNVLVPGFTFERNRLSIAKWSYFKWNSICRYWRSVASNCNIVISVLLTLKSSSFNFSKAKYTTNFYAILRIKSRNRVKVIVKNLKTAALPVIKTMVALKKYINKKFTRGKVKKYNIW